jgi:RecA/RadA recombinase
MEFHLIPVSGKTVARLSHTTLIKTSEQMLDVIGNASYQGAQAVIIHQQQLPEGFFDLKTGLAGDMLQKYSNYRMQLAVVGNFENYNSQSLTQFIQESNRKGQVIFVGSEKEALEKL